MIASAKAKLLHIRRTIRFSAFDTSTADGRSQERYRRASLTTLASGFARVISVLTSLVSVRLTLQYLGTERYGLWMTISSVIAVLGFSDLGINNSLLNGIAKAHGRDDRQLARQYVSSAFFMLALVALVLGVLFSIVYPWVPWAAFFRVRSAQAVTEAGPAIAMFAGCFLLTIPAGVAGRVQSGYQEGYIANLWTAFGSILGLISLLVVIHFHGSLALLVLAMAGAPIVALLMNSGSVFGFERPWLRPSWRDVKKVVTKDLIRLGGLFFVLQLASAMSYSADNIVLERIMGPDAVTQYAVPCKMFSLVAMVVTFLVAPLWPAYGEALERSDHAWIRRTFFRSLVLVVGVSVVLSGVLVIFGKRILHLWVGPTIHPSLLLLLGLGVWGVLNAACGAMASFLNGLSVVRFQVIAASTAAVANITISVYLTERIGLSGVVYGSVLSQVLFMILPSYWYFRRYFKRMQSVANGLSFTEAN